MAENITYLQILRRGWWIILLTVLAAVTAALVATSRMPAQYQSLSRYVVGPNADLVQDTDLLRSLDTLERGTIIATYAEIFRSESVTSAALQEIQLTKQAAESYLITSYGLPETNILVISVRGTNPNMVMELNQAIANQGLAYIETLNQVYSLNLLDAPQQPDAPVGPDQLRNVGIALVLGIGLGGLLALLRTSIVPATRPVLTQDEAAAEVPVSASQKNRVSSI